MISESHPANRKELLRARDNKDFKSQRVWDVEVLKEKDYFRQGYLPYGDKKVYKTDHLICSDQKNLD